MTFYLTTALATLTTTTVILVSSIHGSSLAWW